MYKPEDLKEREVRILKMLLEKRNVASAIIRNENNISKATLSADLKRIRECTGLDIVAQKDGNVCLRTQGEPEAEQLLQLEYEPITRNTIWEWMVLYVLKAEGRGLTFKKLTEGVSEFFGADVSDTFFRKKLKTLVEKGYVEETAIQKKNNMHIYLIKDEAPMFELLTLEELEQMKEALNRIVSESRGD